VRGFSGVKGVGVGGKDNPEGAWWALTSLNPPIVVKNQYRRIKFAESGRLWPVTG